MTETLPIAAIALLVLLFAFLAILAGLALAVTRLAGGGKGGGSGNRGLLGGLAAALALVFLCGLGAVGTCATLGSMAVATAVHANPIERIEIRRPAPTEGLAPAPAEPVHLLFTVHGRAEEALLSLLEDVSGLTREELLEELAVERRRTLEGGELYVYDLPLSLTEGDVREAEHEIRRELGEARLRLPEGVTIHFEGAHRLP